MSKKKPIYTFEKQLKKQKATFDMFVDWLKTCRGLTSITLADDAEERDGIDIWAIREGGFPPFPTPIQVKVDFQMHRTGNIAVETVGKASYTNGWKPGWLSLLHNTRWLVYICAETSEFRIYQSKQFYKHVMVNYNTYRSFAALNGSPDGGEFWHGLGILVPVDTIKHLVIKRGWCDSTKAKKGEEATS